MTSVAIAESELPDYIHRTRFLERLSVTFYIWPVACSLHVKNVTAIVGARNALTSAIKTDNTSMPRSLTRSHLPSNSIEIYWTLLFTALYREEWDLRVTDGGTRVLPWLDDGQCSLFTGLSDARSSLTLFEDRLANFAALYYAVLDRHLRSENDLAAKWWKPLTGEVKGMRQELSTQLGVNGAQLIVGLICVLVLLCTSLFSMGWRRRADGILWSGGVIDMISLIRDPSIPQLIVGDKEDDHSELARLNRAEQIEVS